MLSITYFFDPRGSAKSFLSYDSSIADTSISLSDLPCPKTFVAYYLKPHRISFFSHFKQLIPDKTTYVNADDDVKSGWKKIFPLPSTEYSMMSK